jgi:opacity protein-like surface antigen
MTGSLVRFSSTMGTLAAIVIIGLSGPLRAEDEVAMASDGWRFGVTPYVWFAGLKGDVATFPRLPPVSIDAGFGDIIDDADFALMLAAEARKDRFGIVADLSYLSLSTDGNTSGPLFGGADVDARTFFGTVAGLYRAVKTDRINVDVGAGIRIWYVDTEISFNAGLLPGRSVQDDQVWEDPIIGLRFDAELGRGFSFAAAGDVGGFDLSSKLTWQLLGTVDYRFNDWFSVRAGYRYLVVNYEDDGFVWDVNLSGPIVGAVFRF